MLFIGNGTLITRNSKDPLLLHGAVIIDQDSIVAYGKESEMKSQWNESDYEYIDAHGGLIMPAFINMHEHIYSAFARGLSLRGYDPKGFLDILDGMWWTIDRNLDFDSTYHSAMVTYIDCIKNGVTTIFDHHASFGQIEGSLSEIERAARKTGVRSCLCYEISDRDGEEKRKASIRENFDFIKHIKEQTDDLIAAMIGMHASFTLSDRTLYECASLKPDDVGYHIHVAEGIEDLHDCLHKHHRRIIDRLMDFDMLGEKTMTAHCIYINQHEMELLKETDTMVVHNPESNMGNACGCPPTMDIYHHGILTGLGTDGYTHDMMESYKVANILHKHHLCDSQAAWSEVPDMLFRQNALMANRYFKKKLGVIEEGSSADVIIADYQPITPMDASNINSHLLFGINGKSIVTTISSGKVLMKDRILTGIDEEKELADARQSAAALWKRINQGK